MVNWKIFKITEKKEWDSWIQFYLDDYINYQNKREKYIGFTSIPRWNFYLYQVGDCLEIDLDRMKFENSCMSFFDHRGWLRGKYHYEAGSSSSSTNIVGVSSSSSDIIVSPSAVNYMKSQEARELVQEMSRMVDDTGKEVEYKIQVESKDGKKISHSLILRKT